MPFIGGIFMIKKNSLVALVLLVIFGGVVAYATLADRNDTSDLVIQNADENSLATEETMSGKTADAIKLEPKNPNNDPGGKYSQDFGVSNTEFYSISTGEVVKPNDANDKEADPNNAVSEEASPVSDVTVSEEANLIPNNAISEEANPVPSDAVDEEASLIPSNVISEEASPVSDDTIIGEPASVTYEPDSDVFGEESTNDDEWEALTPVEYVMPLYY
jgi:hypothetical protein